VDSLSLASREQCKLPDCSCVHLSSINFCSSTIVLRVVESEGRAPWRIENWNVVQVRCTCKKKNHLTFHIDCNRSPGNYHTIRLSADKPTPNGNLERRDLLIFGMKDNLFCVSTGILYSEHNCSTTSTMYQVPGETNTVTVLC
jgi:hypothetical protein